MERVALIELAHKGDKEARDTLVQENVGLIWSIVRRFSNRGYEMEDLFQIGCIGLIKAIDKFDNSFEVKFSTYAVPLIMGEIKRFMRDDGMVKVSRTVKENGWKTSRASAKLVQKLGRDPTLEELAKETELTKEEIVVAMEANVDVESIYKSVYQNDGSEIYLLDQLESKSTTTDGVDKVINNMVLEQLLSELSDVEREIIMMRYFQEKTQTEIAKQLGISQVQVSRMEKKILLRMRKKL